MSTAARLDGAALESGGRFRLHPTDLTIRAGAVTAVVGRNGSGKSSLLALLAGELACTSGRVLIADVDIATMRHDERARRRALLTQDTIVSFGFSVEEVVSWGRGPWRRTPAAADDTRIIETALATQGLTEMRDRPVTSLSGGERKRVHLARVLAQQSPLLLLDEADSDLDVVGRTVLDDVVLDHARAGNTAVVVSHDLTRLSRICDDAIVLSEGRVLAHGPRADVLTPEVLQQAFGVPVSLL
jgi:iron complex transport system ATP-binding protein